MVIDECVVENLILSEDYSKGSSCTFVRLDPFKGLKLYRSEDDRDNAYENHEAVFNATSRAPEIFDKIEVAGYWGYVTQVAETLCDVDNCEEMYDAEQKYSSEIEECLQELREAGFYYSDDHGGNFGFIDGHLVIIDFDILSYQDYEEDNESPECDCSACRMDREDSDDRLD